MRSQVRSEAEMLIITADESTHPIKSNQIKVSFNCFNRAIISAEGKELSLSLFPSLSLFLSLFLSPCVFVMEECPESRDELSQRKSLHPLLLLLLLLLPTLCHVNYVLLSLSLTLSLFSTMQIGRRSGG